MVIAFAVSAGSHQPELAEPGELLAPRLGRVDRQPAGRGAEHLIAADGPEVAGAEEDDDLVAVLGRLDRVVQAETREPEVLRHATGEVVLPVVEHRG